MKKFNFSKVADLNFVKVTCNFNKNRTLSQAYFNSLITDLEQLFCNRSLSGCF